ncbi:MAG: lysophospholipid acyltransferase family protein [Candidatus Omnitrophota bacterium]
MVMFFLYSIGQWLALSLPLSLAYRVGAWFTFFKYVFSPGERRAMRNNLKVILGENHPGVKKYPKQIYANFGKYLVNFFRTEEVDKQFIEKYIRIKNKQNMEEALSKGKGAIGLTAHIGNWELCAQVMGILGYKMNAVALSHNNKKIDDFFVQQRQRKGINVIPVGISVRKCFSALKNNEIVGILGDRDFSGENGIFVNFLGKELFAPLGAAVLSLRTGAAIVPAFVIRDEKDDRYFDYIFEKPIYPEKTGNEKQEVRTLTQKYVDVIAKYVKKYPTQWFVFHEFWKATKSEIV